MALILDPCSARINRASLDFSQEERRAKLARYWWAEPLGGGGLGGHPEPPGRGLDPPSLRPPVKWASSFGPLSILQRPVLLALQQSQQRGLERGVPHLVERHKSDRTTLGIPQWLPPFLLHPLQRVSGTSG